MTRRNLKYPRYINDIGSILFLDRDCISWGHNFENVLMMVAGVEG
jgi:hypothetical protein